MYPAHPRRFGFDAASAEIETESLLETVPDLLSLTFALREARPGEWSASTGQIRHIALKYAPARFELPCSGGLCRDGTYDLTAKVLAALARRRVRFEGEVGCSGRHGGARCPRALRFFAAATYRLALPPPW
ncbi:MAG TPA: hypothetical protein VFS00_31660, partial [Polyangiaceae bacterium]|nr:hypothetical protein [Polyangiaceae bacterium]